MLLFFTTIKIHNILAVLITAPTVAREEKVESTHVYIRTDGARDDLWIGLGIVCADLDGIVDANLA